MDFEPQIPWTLSPKFHNPKIVGPSGREKCTWSVELEGCNGILLRLFGVPSLSAKARNLNMSLN